MNKLIRSLVLASMIVLAGMSLAFAIEDIAFAQGSGDAAAAVPTLSHDPVQSPAAAAADSWVLVQQFGIFWGGMVVVYAVGTVLAKKAEDEHWIHNDHVLPGITGGLGILGAILGARFGGAAWSNVPLAIMSGVFLMIQKPKKSDPGSAATVGAVAGGGAAVALMLAIAMTASTPACSSMSQDTKDTLSAGAKAGLACGEAKVGATVTGLGITVGEDVAKILAAGRDGYKGELDALKAEYTGAAVDCAAKMAIGIWRSQMGGAGFETPPAVARAQDYIAGKTFQ